MKTYQVIVAPSVPHLTRGTKPGSYSRHIYADSPEAAIEEMRRANRDTHSLATYKAREIAFVEA